MNKASLLKKNHFKPAKAGLLVSQLGQAGLLAGFREVLGTFHLFRLGDQLKPGFFFFLTRDRDVGMP